MKQLLLPFEYENGLSYYRYEEVLPAAISVTGKPLRRFRFRFMKSMGDEAPIYTEQDWDALTAVQLKIDKIDKMVRKPLSLSSRAEERER